jgi:predicted NBD/HSP70 family sugar kinase
MKAFVASDLKEMNRRTVYSFITTTGETSKAEISRKTGISAPTVIKIINHFIEKGLVREQVANDIDIQSSSSGKRPRTMGRKPCALTFNHNAAFALGVEFEGNYLKIGLINLAYETVLFERIHVDSDFETILTRRLPKIIKTMLKHQTDGSVPQEVAPRIMLGLGIGLPSVFDPTTMVIEATPLIGLATRFAARGLLDKLEHDLAIPVFIENDVKAASLGEYRSRGSGLRDLLYVSLGTGFAAGIILNGVLRKGPRNIAGEIGYLINREPRTNSLDRPGALEQEVNISFIERKLGLSWEVVTADSSMRDTISALIVTPVAVAIANLCITLDIDCVVLGGVLTEYLGANFITMVHAQVRRMVIMDVQVSATVHREPGIVGAAHLVISSTLDSLLS